MPSQYLELDDFPIYGAPVGTTKAQVLQASTLIDAYLQRPEGLAFVTDQVGNPLYMKALTPTMTYLVGAGLVPGVNVSATLSGPTQSLKRGDVLVAGKSSLATAEVLEVSVVNGNLVTFRNVVNTHAGGVSLEAGLTIYETKQFPTQRPVMLVSRNPVQRVFAAQGRYGYSRRGSYNQPAQPFNLLDVVSQFGGPPIWETIDIATMDINVHTGELWIPSGIMMAYYTEVAIHYIAGFKDIPPVVKNATVSVIKAQTASPMEGNVKLLSAGDTQIERFISSVMSEDTMISLKPYRARTFV